MSEADEPKRDGGCPPTDCSRLPDSLMARMRECQRIWGMGFPCISDELLLPFWQKATGLVETLRQSEHRQAIRAKLAERELAKWVEWARMHGHLEHAGGIVDATREILSENEQADL